MSDDRVDAAIDALDVRIGLLQHLRLALVCSDYHAVLRAEAALPPQAVPPQVEAARRALRPGATVDPAPERQQAPEWVPSVGDFGPGGGSNG